ncbi:Spo0E family sporulation regulatory protein-aspartic acid phosphatase [Halobacillus litoralis]|uniref:Spo0E family sporulation regulatory protein-aspartic acid phosphatase n=1 Tax=Halobacillus litoralis TaxID=45668 RepID=A0A845FEI0_9BACI|nr:aspartyl-phosphate phosphatase Spo0E family protein [Halobacillus litoralis]MYL72229.1 Spo0E family sporulation regulatory protein-aspartic acid phosphatase [Halobacillus litoralis]
MDCEKLKNEIEDKRREMYQAFLIDQNYNNALTKSQELDAMLNKFRRLCQKPFIIAMSILML